MTDAPISETDRLIALAKQVAQKFELDPALVCSVVEQESGWDPWLIQYDPFFSAKNVASQYTANKISATEAFAQGIRWGLMRVHGHFAREKGVTVKNLSQLCDPVHGLEIGCQKLSDELQRHAGDVDKALYSFNGGGTQSYVLEVKARLEHYQCQPPTTAP